MKPPIGGGSKKVLYTLNTVRRIGLASAHKALRANNACKACGLGMGGQRGGMVNELGEFPSICNKSVQAQSTDIQPPIPDAIFKHPLAELKELSAHELEHLGRLGTPLYKAADAQRFAPVSWQWALDHSAAQFAASSAERSFFYASGRSSNEAGFLLQLLARCYGSNNVNNCSYYCHQATSVGLEASLGTATATVELRDLAAADTIFVIGANPASNHPRFIHQLKACRERGGQVIVINPAKEPGLVRFAVPKSAKSLLLGGTEIASHYLQPHIGGDMALLKGLAKALLAVHGEDSEFIDAHCSGFADYRRDIAATPWQDLVAQSGIAQQQMEALAALYCQSRNAIFAWGMGITHHAFGVQNVESICNLALLRGMLGRPGAGLLPLRGHSNVQGMGTIGVKPTLSQAMQEQLLATLDIQLPQSPGLDTYHALVAAHQGEMANALLLGGNLYSASPNATWARTALNRVGFKCFLTTTLNQGHLYGNDSSACVILPVAARDEEPQPTTQESMFNFVRLSDGGLSRISQARSEVAVLADLAARLMPESPVPWQAFKNHKNLREAIAASVPGLAELAHIDTSREEFHIPGRLMHHARFNTSDRKAHFVQHPLPKARAAEFPFLLASVRSEGQFNSIIYEETDSYRYGAGRDAVLMSPDDIRQYGLKEGQRVALQSPYGRMDKVSVQAFDLPSGNLMAYYPEANVLTGNALDPRSLTPAFKSIPVRIER